MHPHGQEETGAQATGASGRGDFFGGVSKGPKNFRGRSSTAYQSTPVDSAQKIVKEIECH